MLTAKHMAKTERTPDGHLLWRGALGNGYPVMKHEGRTAYVKRVQWQQTYGPIPPGMVVASSCGKKACIEPGHLALTKPGRIGGRKDARGKYARE